MNPTPFILQLLGLIRTTQMHGAANAAVGQAVARLAGAINGLYTGKPISLQLVDDIVLIDEVRQTYRGEYVAQLRELLAERGVGGFRFTRAAEEGALRRFVMAFAQPVRSPADADRIRDDLRAIGDVGIEVLEPKTLAGVDDFDAIEVTTMSYALQTYARAVVGFREIVLALQAGKDPFASRLDVVHVVQDLVDLANRRMDLLLEILEVRRANEQVIEEGYAEMHAANTCVYAILLGKLLGLHRVQLLDLGTSALLADVGFALLPRELTERPETLSPVQAAELRTFMVRAVQSTLGGQLGDAMIRRVIVAHEHHTPHAARGKKNDTHPYSRVVAVADAFDALLTGRSWRGRHTPEQALALLQHESGRQYDPVVLGALESLFRITEVREPQQAFAGLAADLL